MMSRNATPNHLPFRLLLWLLAALLLVVLGTFLQMAQSVDTFRYLDALLDTAAPVLEAVHVENGCGAIQEVHVSASMMQYPAWVHQCHTESNNTNQKVL
eukprot:scaffold481_cov63-Attheya_sp.AAC.11